jgi:hypothetical protein
VRVRSPRSLTNTRLEGVSAGQSRGVVQRKPCSARLDSLDSLDPTHSPKASLTRSRGSEIPALAASSMASSDEIGGLCEAGEDE